MIVLVLNVLMAPAGALVLILFLLLPLPSQFPLLVEAHLRFFLSLLLLASQLILAPRVPAVPAVALKRDPAAAASAAAGRTHAGGTRVLRRLPGLTTSHSPGASARVWTRRRAATASACRSCSAASAPGCRGGAAVPRRPLPRWTAVDGPGSAMSSWLWWPIALVASAGGASFGRGRRWPPTRKPMSRPYRRWHGPRATWRRHTGAPRAAAAAWHSRRAVTQAPLQSSGPAPAPCQALRRRRWGSPGSAGLRGLPKHAALEPPAPSLHSGCSPGHAPSAAPPPVAPARPPVPLLPRRRQAPSTAPPLSPRARRPRKRHGCREALPRRQGPLPGSASWRCCPASP